MVTRPRTIIAWCLVGVTASLLLAWAFPRAYPLFPGDWQISKQDAEAIGLERLRDLGPLPEGSYVVTRQDDSTAIEHRLNSFLEDGTARDLLDSELVKSLRTWEVVVWDRGARPQEWKYRARISPAGEVIELLQRFPPEEAGEALDVEAARVRADEFLRDQEIDLATFLEPEIRTRQLQARTDLFLRYGFREAILGPDYPYGVEVVFAGARLAGYSRYFDDPEIAAIRDSFQPLQLLGQAKVFLPLILLPIVAIPFLRRYHAGEIGVHRGLQISAVIVVCGLLTMLFGAADASAGWSLGVLSRQQVNLVVAFQMVILFYFPMALMAFLSWSTGESLCRVRHGRRLAAFDALFQGDLNNATFAQASLRGPVSGLVLLASLWLLAAAARKLGVWAYSGFMIGPWWESSAWFSVPLVAHGLAYALYTGLFGRLFLVSIADRWFGRWGAICFSALAAVVLFFATTYVFPFQWNFAFWILEALAFVFLFLRYGIYTSALASFTVYVVSNAVPYLAAPDPEMQVQASLALLGPLLPLLLSVKHLASDKRFVYRYDDIPPHVRRIAERERQRVELETARGIQASILPQLPPVLNGVRMTHKYLPATEVGGDFYDVLALEDGRLAVAVGDVAGHGVSSGLVMSMTKSALSVQVTFDPEVAAVFRTLNRLVYQSARKRMLATLCYALVDPERLELSFASAGHLFPYRIDVEGRVEALESIAYPLGVRESLPIRVRTARLDAGDTLFLFSDGVVEAHRESDEELFGFERLEASLVRHSGRGVDELRDGVLGDLETFTAGAPREDDLTVLVLQLP